MKQELPQEQIASSLPTKTFSDELPTDLDVIDVYQNYVSEEAARVKFLEGKSPFEPYQHVKFEKVHWLQANGIHNDLSVYVVPVKRGVGNRLFNDLWCVYFTTKLTPHPRTDFYLRFPE